MDDAIGSRDVRLNQSSRADENPPIGELRRDPLSLDRRYLASIKGFAQRHLA